MSGQNATSREPAEGLGSGAPGARDPALNREYQELERTADYVIATWRRVMLLIWLGAQTAGGILRSRTLMERWAANPGEGVVLVVLMPRSGPSLPPNDEARAAMVQASREARPGFMGIGMITHHGGFIAAAIRSVMTARQLLVRDPVPFKMFATAEEAAPWVLERTRLPKTLAGEFARVVEAAQ